MISKKVSFTAMEHGNRCDNDLALEHDAENIQGQADRVIEWLKSMDGDSPNKISRLDHCLQGATRAKRDGADEETMICTLLHDIGDVICPANQSQAAAALLSPYVSEKTYWVALHHGLLQGYY
ncbi:MAG: hypothetical protein P8O06_05065 [Porticoccaceae bacterium]|nr:hypothetical protein [Porticoccaceae bacterium]